MRKFFTIFCFFILVYTFIYISRNKSSAFYNNLGAELYEKGSYAEAITYYKKSLAISPGNYLTHLNLANAYKISNHKNAAITEYMKCLQLNPTGYSAHKSLSQIYLEKQMYADAIAHLKKGLSLAPADKGIKELLDNAFVSAANDYSSKAIAEFISGNKEYAYKLVNNALTLNAGSAYPHYLLAYFYYNEHNFDKAISEIEKSLKIDAQFQLANKLLGDIYFDNGSYLQAIEQYKIALSMNTNDYILYNNIAIALVRLGHYQEAIAYIKRASELAPGNPNILYSLACIYRDNNMLELSFSEYNKLPDYPNVHNDLAGIYLAQGKKKEAFLEYNKQIQDCKRKLSVNPSDALILNILAAAYIGTEQYNNAETAVNEAIAIHPNYKQNYIILANIQKKAGKNTLVAKTLEKAYQLPDNPELKIINSNISNMENGLKPFIETEAFTGLDQVYLKNGRVFEGVIKNETPEKVTLEVTVGNSTGEMTLYNYTIARIIKAKKKK